MNKTRSLTPDQHRSRLTSGVCPRCGDYRLVRQMRVKSSPDGGEPRFAGAYYTCGGPLAHECYHLSGETGTRLSESTEGVDPPRDQKKTVSPEKSKIIRRPHKTIPE